MRNFLRRNLPLLIVMGVLTSLVAIAAAKQPPVLPAGSWGLSFQTQGQPPVGNTSNDRLKEYGAAYLGDTSQKKIYLTFDSGYENGCTAQILDTLKKHNIHAAFFLVGNYIEKNPELVRRMVDEGHIVGNHTYHHWDMSKISDPARFRQELGYHTVFWSLAYVDWLNDKQPTSEQAFSKLIPRIHDGAVVLLHSTSKTNAAILDDLLTRWESMGYTFGTVEELFS